MPIWCGWQRECKTFAIEIYFCVEKNSRLPPYSNDRSDDLNHPTEVPKGNLAVNEERLHFFCSFLVSFFSFACFVLLISVVMQQPCVRPDSERKLFSLFLSPSFFLLGENRHCKILFYFCSIKGNKAQKVSCNKGLRKNSLKSGYHLQRYLKKAGSSSVWHLVLFGKTKKGSRLQYCSLLVENCKCLWHGLLSKSIRKEESCLFL